MDYTKNVLLQILTVFAIISITSCGDDICEVIKVDDSISTLSITGKVFNAYDNSGVENVKLSMLDQFGGSAIIQWDTLSTSNKDGCFQYNYDRDTHQLMALMEQHPSVSLDNINQSLRTIDTRYYFLYNKVGPTIIESFRRWTYDPLQKVEMYVTPAARIQFVSSNYDLKELNFRWFFTESELDEFNLMESFLIHDNIWKIPSGRQLSIEVFNEQREIVHSTSITATWQNLEIISF